MVVAIPCRPRADSTSARMRWFAWNIAQFRRLPSRPSAGWYSSGQVLSSVQTRVLGDRLLDGVDGRPRRDLARLVAAHAVGDEEQAEVGARAVAVFVVLPANAGMRRRGEEHRHYPRVRALVATFSRVIAFRRLTRARSMSRSRWAIGQPLLGALLRRLGAVDVDLVGAFGDRGEDDDAVGRHLRHAAGDRQVVLLGALAIPERADLQERQHAACGPGSTPK